MTVEEILKVFEEGKFNTFKLETKIFTSDTNAFVCEFVEQPCVALAQLTIPQNRIKGLEKKESKYVKVVAIINGYDNLKHVHCITIEEFLRFLKHVDDKQQNVCVADYSDLSAGNVSVVRGIIHAQKSYCKNKALRNLFGDEAIQIQY